MGHSFKTIRFKPEELRDIEQFLTLNPVFDFSTLARTSIAEFIRNPVIKVQGISNDKKLFLSQPSKRRGETNERT